jgi:CDP-diacylglycerol--serine O-phosphatidyltransferase
MQERPVPRHKSIYILPNLFTTASLFAGFWGILSAAKGTAAGFVFCALAILFSALMDALDGKVARLTNTTSEFGVQYDSLADLAAFGVAPAFMIYQYALHTFNMWGVAAAFLFTVCGALRLARFNTAAPSADKRFFTGLPIPAAGCALASIVLINPSLPEFLQNNIGHIALFCTATLAFLMVSRIRYASFKELGAFKAHPFRSMVFAIALFALMVADFKVFVSLSLFGYIISGLVYTFVLLPRMALSANRTPSQATEHMPENEVAKPEAHK